MDENPRQEPQEQGPEPKPRKKWRPMQVFLHVNALCCFFVFAAHLLGWLSDGWFYMTAYTLLGAVLIAVVVAKKTGRLAGFVRRFLLS